MSSKRDILIIASGIMLGVAALRFIEYYRPGISGFRPHSGQSKVADALAPNAASAPVGAERVMSEATVNSEESISSSRHNAIVKATGKISPSVVSITVTRTRRSGSSFYRDPFFDLFLYGRQGGSWESVSSIGSGVVVHKNGYIITNSHVIGASPGEKLLDIMVHLPDGREFSARVIGEDGDNDLAVIKITGKRLPVASIQKVEDNMTGEWVVAIGNPFGYLMSDSKPTVTVGVISALNRSFTKGSGIGFYNMIQTDASINPGNSGGALVNAEGDVIGINTFIFTGQSNQQGSIGLGFAIPIQKAMRVVKELINYGYIREWTTGIYTSPYTSASESALTGIIISEVKRGSPGDKAGLKSGDIIYSIAGHKVNDIHDITEILRRFQVGDRVLINFIRQKTKRKTEMLLEEKK